MMRFIFIFTLVLLTACNSDDVEPVTVELSTEFLYGDDDWIAGFSDYPVDDAEIFQLQSGVKEIPNTVDKKGFMLGGMNRSDDLFMYIKKQITGLAPNTRYVLNADISFWSEAGNVCFGIGGSPGDSVYMKAGASEVEPMQADYYMNIDIGSQSEDGSDAKVIGNVSIDGLSCDGGDFGNKELSLSTSANFEIITSPYGDAWVIVGTDSGYEGQTHLYYESVKITLTPVL